MTAPRCIFPGTFWMITRRCLEGMFLLRPDAETNNNFLYCLIEAARKFDIHIILPQMMSNHHHTLIYDPYDNVIEFMARFHAFLAKCQNHHWGRRGNLWNGSPPNVLELVEPHDVVDKLIYAAANPVLSHLVATATEWPGPASVEALLTGVTVTATRPAFFREHGDMPAMVSATFSLPESLLGSELGDRAAILDRVRRGIASIEAECAEQRRQTRRPVVGSARILRQSWRTSPETEPKFRDLNPRVACKRPEMRCYILNRNREFRIGHREARLRLRQGLPAVFPAGTYWLRRHANVTVAEPTPIPPELLLYR